MAVNALSTNYNLLEAANTLHVSSLLTHLQHRIAELSDYRIVGSSHKDDLIHLYSNHYLEDQREIARCGAFDHTMFEAIDTYCSQKFPVDAIKRGLLDGVRFEVHGIFPSHFIQVAGRLGYHNVSEIRFQHNARIKKFNFIRPKFFECINPDGEPTFVVSVNSGRDYVLHYASMLKHIIGMYSLQSADKIGVYRYPLAESSVHIWSGLNAELVKRGDIVILGYVQEVNDHFKRAVSLKKVSRVDTDFYTSIRYRNELGQMINLLGVKFSFWGCISAKVSLQICRLGAQEVIYVGKLGTLTVPDDIYSKIYVPSDFLIMYHDKIVCHIQGLKNRFLEENPSMSTDCHVSVPTVVEEDYVQRHITNKLNITSIDNEISQMAYAVARFNQDMGEQVSFTAMHFSTDYIRRPEERDLQVEFDLSNNRTKMAFVKKTAVLDEISTKLLGYIEKKGST